MGEIKRKLSRQIMGFQNKKVLDFYFKTGNDIKILRVKVLLRK